MNRSVFWLAVLAIAAMMGIFRSICLASQPVDLPVYYPTYYVAPDGDDGNSGLSEDRAWQTLEKVNAANLQPGATVRFRAGGSWRGSLTPISGDQTAPITYASYGEGAKPTLLGSQSRSEPDDWVSVGDDLWATRQMAYRQSGTPTELHDERWRHHQEAGAEVSLNHSTDNGLVTARIACGNSGSKTNHIQLWGPAIPVPPDAWLQLSFRARSSIPFSLSDLDIRLGSAPWTLIAASHDVHSIASDWQQFCTVLHVTEQTSGTVATGHLHINLGGTLPTDAIFEFQLNSIQRVIPTIQDPLNVDVGNIIFDDGAVCGWKKWSLDSLEKPYDFYYDGPSQRVFLKAASNPATLHKSIECAMKRHIVSHSQYPVHQQHMRECRCRLVA